MIAIISMSTASKYIRDHPISPLKELILSSNIMSSMIKKHTQHDE